MEKREQPTKESQKRKKSPTISPIKVSIFISLLFSYIHHVENQTTKKLKQHEQNKDEITNDSKDNESGKI